MILLVTLVFSISSKSVIFLFEPIIVILKVPVDEPLGRHTLLPRPT